MSNGVVLKRGLFNNLPSEAENNVLFFCTDVGRLFQGKGIGNPLVEYGSVLSGYTDLTDLQTKNPQIQGKLYLTNDNKIYRYDNGNYVEISGGSYNPLNKDVLDKLTESPDGKLLYGGNEISGNGTIEFEKAEW